MSRRIVFLPVAAADVRQAVQWHQRQVNGLGRAFLADLKQQLRRVAQFPESYPRIESDCRRSSLERFPYTIMYRLSPSVIQVIAVLHHHREPDVITHRAQDSSD